MSRARSTTEPMHYTLESLRGEASHLFSVIRRCSRAKQAQARLFALVSEKQHDAGRSVSRLPLDERAIVRDCARAFRGMLKDSSEAKSGFSVARALWDLSRGKPRPDLGPGFFAEILHLVRGIEGRAPYRSPYAVTGGRNRSGREAALARSRELDRIWVRVSGFLERYPDGLDQEAFERRRRRRDRILSVLGGRPEDWLDWRWHVRHVVKEVRLLSRMVPLHPQEVENIERSRAARLPFGATPYYLSLLDDDPDAGRDRALRAQILPTARYVEEMCAHRGERHRAFDFMLERDTSPVDLVTRRYPAVVILKPFNTCPQICTYCQRNWEIDDAMAPNALASPGKIAAAIDWIEKHPAVREVLVTGGDPLVLGGGPLRSILGRLARIESVDLVRIGTRTPVTLPMRITDRLASLLGSFRMPGRREVCIVTHVEHPYEVTPAFVDAVNRLRMQGIAVYNQHVYHFFVSRRFEAAKLRMVLRCAGVDPYYTFLPKGKRETDDYRIPIARVMQEQNEEARLLPGLRRTDEAVFNVPGLGKNYLRAVQSRDLISILPDGSRVYEFHPWEKMAARRETYVSTDMPILTYLNRLADLGEDPGEYSSIWYYF